MMDYNAVAYQITNSVKYENMSFQEIEKLIERALMQAYQDGVKEKTKECHRSLFDDIPFFY